MDLSDECIASDRYQQALQSIENCLLPKLTVEEGYSREVLEIYKQQFIENFNVLTKEKKPYIKDSTEVLAGILILYKELQSDGDWKSEFSAKHAKQLRVFCRKSIGIQLDSLLKGEHEIDQEIFDICMEKLHQKLTAEDFRKYPSLIEVYYSLLFDGHVSFCLVSYAKFLANVHTIMVNDFA